MVQFETANQILKTLPVSFYLKRKVDVELQDVDTSYCNIFENKIVIGYGQFKNANITNENAESDIRCLLYHEVSHAFLTPLNLVKTIYRWGLLDEQAIINIFEDERIETICKNYYYDVNFKQFVKKLNHFDSSIPVTNEMEYFYHIVRFDTGDINLVNEKNAIILKFKNLNRETNCDLSRDYHDEIIAFYRKVASNFASIASNQNNNSGNEEENNEEENTNNNVSNTSNEENDENKTDETISSSITEGKGENNDTFVESIENAIKDFNTSMNSLHDEDMKQKLEEIILRKKTFKKQNGSAINSYSGVFDARSVARNDYKYFVKKNRLGNAKKFSKIKLNLFIDCSGSFSDSEEVVNKMLFNLSLLEKQDKDFSFDLVKMTTTDTLTKKSERQIKCSGCNDIKKSIFATYDKVNSNDADNINIVLFDGDAFSDVTTNVRLNHMKNFGAFNHNNCIIISNGSNKYAIESYAKNAKSVFINSQYDTMLIKTILSMLRQSF